MRFTNLERWSESFSRWRSTSCRITVAVNVLVMLAIRTWSLTENGAWVLTSAVPNVWMYVPLPGIQIPTAIPGVLEVTIAFLMIEVMVATVPGANRGAWGRA